MSALFRIYPAGQFLYSMRKGIEMITIEIMFVAPGGELQYIYVADTDLMSAFIRFRDKCGLPCIRLIEHRLPK
jgi:hypothetical protein